MIINQSILDSLSSHAAESPRLRMNLDLRNSPEDNSQRMLNAVEPGSKVPIHRHRMSSETVVCVRGHFKECFYDDGGNLTDIFDMVPGGLILNIPINQWHSVESLECGTVMLECKDGIWEPTNPEDILE